MLNNDKNANLTFLKVSDGLVELSQKVWWKYENGPITVDVKDHITNIKLFSELYSIKKPAPYPTPFNP